METDNTSYMEIYYTGLIDATHTVDWECIEGCDANAGLIPLEAGRYHFDSGVDGVYNEYLVLQLPKEFVLENKFTIAV